MPGEPLVFVHVALVPEMADGIRYIKQMTGHKAQEDKAEAAMFYSISSTQAGLAGVELGNFLIKRVHSPSTNSST